jgi:AcrR family transcriptional regulator
VASSPQLSGSGVSVPADAPAGASTRVRLLAAAYELLVQEGYQATTVQGVARRAGLTSGAIYANFVNKQELMSLAVLDHWGHVQLQLGALMANPDVVADDVAAGDDWAHHGLVRYLAHLLSEPAGPEHRALTEVTGAVMRDPDDSPLLSGLEVLDHVYRQSIERAKEAGTIDPGLATDALVALLRGIYLGAITSKSWGMEQPDFEDIVHVLMAVNRGLGLGSG